MQKPRFFAPALAALVILAAPPSRAAGPYLPGHALDAVDLLPPPPTPGSAEDRADADAAYRAYAARTPAEVALGTSETKLTIFHFTLDIGPWFQPGKFPLTEALFAGVEAEIKVVTNTGKDHWRRLRPYHADPARFSDPIEHEKETSYSYPSGHSTRGTVFALLLAELFPDKRDAILARGREVGWLRVTGGVHYPTDIYAGRVLGQALVRAFHASPAFQRDFAAVRAELGGPASVTVAPNHRVVVIVWDGMRPDFVTTQNTPQLWTLAQSGVFFADHHPVYLSSTEVNGTAMATGDYPAHSHVIANTDYRPRIDPVHTVGIEIPAVIRKGDEVSGGHYLAAPTVAEILHAHGLATVIAGSKDVALLHDRAVRAEAPGVSPVLFQGETQPPALAAAVTAALGAFPAPGKPDDKRDRDDWTAQALIGTLWKDGVPPYTLLWLAEPDSTQHVTGPGSPESLAAIKNCDEVLGRVLADLDRRGLRASTDVMVVSDHGFSTISRKVDVAAELTAAGFDARRSVPGGLQPGQVMTVSDGGTTLLYVGGHDAAVCARLAAWLQQQDWTGVIFAREALDGTFPLATAHLDPPEAPDLIVSLHWTDDRSANGTPGMIVSDLKAGSEKVGNHASLSRFDMHNTLVAAGPDFRAGIRDPLPSANCDVGPTILWVLGLHDEVATMDGRVLGEALTGTAPPLRSFDLRHLTASRPLGGGRTWTQYLNVSEVNGVDYFDAGNGAPVAAP